MKTSKLTVTMMFVASMAWASAANAEEPCGAPADTFESCEIVQAPDCFDACQPGAMVVACAAQTADQCLAECGPQAMIGEGPQDCEIQCGASCMGECAAGCEASEDKASCFAMCSQQCGASCEVSCSETGDEGLDYDNGPAAAIGEGPDSIDNGGVDEYHENNGWRDDDDDHKSHRDDDDDDRSGWRDDDDDDKSGWRDDDDDDKSGWRDDDDDKSGSGFRDDDDDDKSGWRDDDDDHKMEVPASGGLDITQDCQSACMESEAVNICAPQMANSCMDACDSGAVLLCDGQYLQVNDVDACIAALEQVGVSIDESTAAFNGDELLTETLQGASCSVEQPKNARFAGGLFALFSLGLGAGFLRRRRRG